MVELIHKIYNVRIFDNHREMDEFYGAVPCNPDGSDLTPEQLDEHYKEQEIMLATEHFAPPGTEPEPIDIYMDAGMADDSVGDIFMNSINVIPMEKVIKESSARSMLAHELGHLIESDQPYLKNPVLPEEWRASSELNETETSLEESMAKFYDSDYYRHSEGKAIFFQTFFDDAVSIGDMVISHLKSKGHILI